HYLENTESLKQNLPQTRNIFLTDENIFRLYPDFFAGQETIVIPAGEESKSLSALEIISRKLVDLDADRKTVLTGVGGGVITDFTGFIASVFMRGLPFGFVPTSLLAMVDAAIGGKNGVNLGIYKNMLGAIRQPGFILISPEFLNSLPEEEWSNGFAEIIKYGCILDASLFDFLEEKNIEFFRKNPSETQKIIRVCTEWKTRIVQQDEHEHGIRKLLNFGHTLGHALEKKQELPHGAAISIGMVLAARISEKITGLHPEFSDRLERVLIRYRFPDRSEFLTHEVMQILKKDKKRSGEKIAFILLEKPGKAEIHALDWMVIEEALEEFSILPKGNGK